MLELSSLSEGRIGTRRGTPYHPYLCAYGLGGREKRLPFRTRRLSLEPDRVAVATVLSLEPDFVIRTNLGV